MRQPVWSVYCALVFVDYLCTLKNIHHIHDSAMTFTTRLLTACVALVAASGLHAAEMPDSTFSYKPRFHATLRARWEVETHGGLQRFQVRNANISAEGNMTRWADYFIYGDLCDRGSIKLLDAWARMRYDRYGLFFQAGQMRMPFGTDISRGPHNYYFANRSFIGMQINNFRGVGAKLGWSMPMAPLTIEAGMFNTTPTGNHMVWNHGVNYSFKATAESHGWLASAAFLSVKPYGFRSNLVDVTLSWSDARWHVEAEYVRQHYCGDAHKPTDGYMAMADYTLPLPMSWFNRLSFQGRFDGMTAHSDLLPDDTGHLTDTDPSRKRVTLGATMKYLRAASAYVALRLNYEKYFYDSGTEAPLGKGDKFLAELVFNF